MAESLGEAVLRVSVDSSQFNTGISQIQSKAKTLSSLKIDLGNTESQLQKLDAFTKQLNPGKAQALTQQIAALKQEIAGVEAASGGLGKVSEVLGALGIGLGVGAAVVGLKQALTFAVQTANDFEKLNQQLTLLTGNAQTTAAVLSQLRQYANATPFDLPEVANVAKQLLAYGFTANEAVDLTKRLGDVSTVTGANLGYLATNLGQSKSVGKSFTVDLRQFASAGIPIFESLAKVSGRTVAELKGLEGIPYDLVVKAFRQMTDEGGKFYQGGEKGGTALDRNFATLGDSAKNLGNAIGKTLTPVLANIFDSAGKSTQDWADRLDRVIAKVNELSKNPIVKGIADQRAGAEKLLNTKPISYLANPLGRFQAIGDALDLFAPPKPGTGGAQPVPEDYKKIKDASEEKLKAETKITKELVGQYGLSKSQQSIYDQRLKTAKEIENLSKEAATLQLNQKAKAKEAADANAAYNIAKLSLGVKPAPQQPGFIGPQDSPVTQKDLDQLKVKADALRLASVAAGQEYYNAAIKIALTSQQAQRDLNNLADQKVQALDSVRLSNRVATASIGTEGLQRTSIQGVENVAQAGLELRGAIRQGVDGPELKTFVEKLKGAALSFKDSLTSGIKQAQQGLEDAKQSLLGLQLDNSRFLTPQEKANASAQLNRDFQAAGAQSGRNVQITGSADYVQREQRAFIDFVKNEGRGQQNIGTLQTGLNAANDALANTNKALSGDLTNLAGLIPGLTQALQAVAGRNNNLTFYVSSGSTTPVPTGIN